MPRTRLTLTYKGSGYVLSMKRRINLDGETVEYLAADSLQSYVTGLYRAARLHNAASHSGRCAFASRLFANGHRLKTEQFLHGHAHLATSPYTSKSHRATGAKPLPLLKSFLAKANSNECR